jgi:hypothetical protein
LWDRWITASYVLAVWPLYVVAIDPWAKWWALYAILVSQFALAGGEAIQSMLGEKKRRQDRPPGGVNGLAFAGAGDGT